MPPSRQCLTIVFLALATGVSGLVQLHPAARGPLLKFAPQQRVLARFGPSARPHMVRMAAAGGSADGSGESGALRTKLLRPTLLGAGAAALLSLGSRYPSMLIILLQVVSVGWPLWSANKLWRDGKRRAAITLGLSAAARRFSTRWWQYMTIPLFAGAVGWLTNKARV